MDVAAGEVCGCGYPYAASILRGGVFCYGAVPQVTAGAEVGTATVLVVCVCVAVGITARDSEAVNRHITDTVTVNHVVGVVGVVVGRIGKVTAENGGETHNIGGRGTVINVVFCSHKTTVKGNAVLHDEGLAPGVCIVAECS